MVMRKLATALTLGALALTAGCCHKSQRVAYNPAACCPKTPCCSPAPAPCCNGAPAAPAVQAFAPGQPPLGAQVPLAQPPYGH
jgi:hypothetical protein